MLDNDTLLIPARGIRLAVFDVDGVLTDGRIILGPGGEEYKAFHVRDGHGLVSLRRAGVDVAIITGRESAAVRVRMQELGVRHVRQGVRDKWAELGGLLRELDVQASEVCYVGDDLPDLEPMRNVGLAIAVADAADEVLEVAAGVTANNGGHGAAREVCDLLLAAGQASAFQAPGSTP